MVPGFAQHDPAIRIRRHLALRPEKNRPPLRSPGSFLHMEAISQADHLTRICQCSTSQSSQLGDVRKASPDHCPVKFLQSGDAGIRGWVENYHAVNTQQLFFHLHALGERYQRGMLQSLDEE